MPSLSGSAQLATAVVVFIFLICLVSKDIWVFGCLSLASMQLCSSTCDAPLIVMLWSRIFVAAFFLKQLLPQIDSSINARLRL